jgi:hypothetical protein
MIPSRERTATTLTFLCTLVLGLQAVSAADPCRSGLEPGKRPGPYSFVMSTGPQRGQSHCYICETGDRPAVAIFARRMHNSLAKLVQQLDKAVSDHPKSDLRAWVTFLSEDQLKLDPQIVGWSRQHAIRHVPLGVFEDTDGPPSYCLARDADVTVLFFVKQKVIANFAFRAGELTDDQIAAVMKSVPELVNDKK